MKSVMFGGAVAALAGVIFGAGMKAPVEARDLPQPELQQISFPVETTSQEDFRPEYIVAASYAPMAWSSEQATLWHSAYAAAPAASPIDQILEGEMIEPADAPALDDGDLTDEPAPAASEGEQAMPYASGMTTRVEPAAAQPAQTRPASSWPNRATDGKQQVLNARDGFEHLTSAEAAA